MLKELTAKEVEQVTKVLTAGNRYSYIYAVKLYRKYSGKGLKESKTAVGVIVAELQRLEPEKFSYLSKRGKGCIAVTVIIFVIAGLVVLLLTTDLWPAITSLLK